MSDSAQAHAVEGVHLSLLPGSGETQGNNNTSDQAIAEQSDTSCINDRYHRKLAICSIICGISCIGIKALINSAKAEETKDPEKATEFSQQAKKFSIISIVTWVAILALMPFLIWMISYLLTLRD